MSLEEKITQKFMPDLRFWKEGNCNSTLIPVTSLTPDLQNMYSKYKFGGVILFSENTPFANQTTVLINQLQEANRVSNKIPMLISIDQEGGAVTNLGGGTVFPGNMAMAATGNSKYVYNVASAIAGEIGSLGFNLNFGLVGDVNSNPNNPVIGVRSFSSHQQIVSEYANQYFQGTKSQNIIACAKHFPGEGDSYLDPKYGFPIVNKTIEQINEVELNPFKSLVDNGIDMIMAAHIQYPALDNSFITSKLDGSSIVVPSSLSKKIITSLLKTQMRFGGVVVSDAMSVDPLLKNVGFEESVSLAFRAGIDIAVMPTIVRCNEETTFYDELITRVKNDISSGLYSVYELDESVIRILSLKRKYKLHKYDDTDISIKISNAVSTVNNPKNKNLEKKVSNYSITLVKNDPTYGIPFKVGSNDKLLVLMPNSTQNDAVVRYIGELGINIEIQSANYTDAVYSSAWENLVDCSTHVILGSMVNKNAPEIIGGNVYIGDQSPDAWAFIFPQNILKRVLEKNLNMAVISLKNPYDVANFEKAPAVICAYGFKGIINGIYGEHNIPSAISTIFGKSKPKGKLPVDIYSIFDNTTIRYPLGFGITM
ncbi:Beta-hexosaminidase [Smittium mucronatum]|uniref:beta-N-acetylhexosaminidase n=1 Tax=Smittium mucronatum TaxID=133383 RepID=A0A1R0H466_9FUNG|nr:Beta-hexosaminidase [Smittium mucronatum]